MNLLMIPRMAVKALAQNKMRTGLTMLGIIIGVGAVICVVAIGEGASASVERAITNIGANMIWVEAGGVNRGGVRTGKFGTKSLTLGDYEAMAHLGNYYAEKIRAAVPSEKLPTRVTVSAGVAAIPQLQIDTPEELVAAADRALYRAKENGRNRVEYEKRDDVVRSPLPVARYSADNEQRATENG